MVKDKKNVTNRVESHVSAPKFPYTTMPNALRRFLQIIPTKPKPIKVNEATLKAWGFRNTNDTTIIRVLKALDLVGTNNEPTNKYHEFMNPNNGPGILAEAIRHVWSPLFENSHEPYKEDDTTIRNYFNVHSGGSEGTISYQIQTFKAVCEHADFGVKSQTVSHSKGPIPSNGISQNGKGGSGVGEPAVHIDLHIHLPENKTRRDYECIFEDIARHLFRYKVEGSSNGHN